MEAIERIYREWDERLAQNDAEGLVALYDFDATFESPLVPHLMNIERGILRGHGELRPFFQKLGQRKPEVRRHYRAGYLTDGRMLMWEYPRELVRRQGSADARVPPLTHRLTLTRPLSSPRSPPGAISRGPCG